MTAGHFLSISMEEGRVEYQELRHALVDGSVVAAGTCLYRVLGPFYYFANMWAQWEVLGIEMKTLVRKVLQLVLRWTTHAKSSEQVEVYLSLKCACLTGSGGARWPYHEKAEEMASTSEFFWISRLALGESRGLSWFVLAEFVKLWRLAMNRCNDKHPNLHTHHLKNLHQDDDIWPRSIKDLLPQGLEGTLQGILQWLRHDPPSLISSALILVYTSLLHFGAPLIPPRLAISRNFFLHAIIHPVQRTWLDAGGTDTDDWNAQALTCVQVQQLMLSLGQLFAAISRSDYHNAASTAMYKHAPQRFFNAMICAMDSCRAIAAACKMEQHPRLMARERERVVEKGLNVFWGWAVRVLLDHDVDIQIDMSDTPHHEVQSEVTLRTQRPAYNIWAGYVELMGYLTYVASQACSAPHCSRSIVDTPLKRCTGCSRMQYCSCRCQKRAWAHSAAPHRDVCSVIAALAREYKIPHLAWPVDEDALEKARPINLIWFPPRARLVIRACKRLAQIRLAWLGRTDQVDTDPCLPHNEYHELGPPRWKKVNLTQYRINQW